LVEDESLMEPINISWSGDLQDGGEFRQAETAPSEPGHLSLTQRAAASLLAENWPDEGRGQDAAVALARELAKRDWQEPEVEAFLCAVLQAVGEDDPARRAQQARRALERSKGEGPNSGRRTLHKLVGREAVGDAFRLLGCAAPRRATETERKSRNMAARLLELVRGSGAELYTDQTGRPYISVGVNGHPENWPVDSRAFKDWLAMQAYRLAGDTANSNSVEEAVKVLCARAKFEGPQREVYLRVGGHGGSIYLDLCDPARRAVEISSTEWRLVDRHPVCFRRTDGMLPLPEPVRGGRLNELGDRGRRPVPNESPPPS
jgi:hypothetical protein